MPKAFILAILTFRNPIFGSIMHEKNAFSILSRNQAISQPILQHAVSGADKSDKTRAKLAEITRMAALTPQGKWSRYFA